MTSSKKNAFAGVVKVCGAAVLMPHQTPPTLSNQQILAPDLNFTTSSLTRKTLRGGHDSNGLRTLVKLACFSFWASIFYAG